ncbi:hypothetical protein EV401DRAFT_2053379 [Pisolithus croceorrhizus]|nr:hypothetical protein EV401DRAFT_2053379 [Pisolithus croceorrhizus]
MIYPATRRSPSVQVSEERRRFQPRLGAVKVALSAMQQGTLPSLLITDCQPVPSTSALPNPPEPLSSYTCPICFSPPTNATLTPCGHICCGPCLFTAVKATVRRNLQTAMNGAPVPRCPVCRAEIPGWDGRGGGVIGLKLHVVYSL